MIEGVKIKKLKWNPDERGKLMEILRNDDEIYSEIGQVYVTTGFPDIVKAWHYHKFQDDHMTVVKGMMKIVLYDGREDSHTKGKVNELYVGEYNPILVKIPRHVYHGFMCVSESEAYVINIVTKSYNREEPDEYRLPWNTDKIPYKWKRKNG